MQNIEQKNEQKAGSEFVAPRHWLGPEELTSGYWDSPQTQEKRGQEFFDKPVETISQIDQTDSAGIARRDFLTVMGASMAMASFACARRPVNKIVPYVSKPEEIQPGLANWYASTAGTYGLDAGVGLLVKTREGRPIKLEGNPEHPLSQGAISARLQASVLDLYDPDRLTGPLGRSRLGENRRTLSWTDLDAGVVAKLKAANGRVRVLTGAMLSETTRSLVGEFLNAFGGGNHIEFDLLGHDDVARGQLESYGAAVLPRYRFEAADAVVSIGADFLGVWPGAVANAKAWSKKRKLDGKKAASSHMSKLLAFESIMTSTGANADVRTAIRAGSELKIALAIAHELIVAGRRTRYATDMSVASALGGFTAEGVAKDLGIDAKTIKKAAEVLWESKGAALVIAGGLHTRSADSVSLQIVVNLLNSALESDGVTVDGSGFAGARVNSENYGVVAFKKLITEMNAGVVDVLVIHGVNPSYTAPAVLGFDEALKKVGTVVTVSLVEDETARVSDFIAADHHFLENWGDAQISKGVYSLQQPAIAPIHETRSFQDSLIAWAKSGGKGTAGIAAAKDWHEYIMNHWRSHEFKELGGSTGFDAFWESALRDGVFAPGAESRSASRAFKVSALAKLPKFKSRNPDEVGLVLYAKPSMGDGSQANNAWLQEMPDPVSTVTWDNYLAIGPGLAKKLSVKKNDVVEVTLGEHKAELPVLVQPGMSDATAAVAVGYGRTAAGKVGNGVGINVLPFVRVKDGELVFAGSSVTLRKTGRVYALAETQWHFATENRPIINDLTLSEFKHNAATANHTDPHLRLETPSLWPSHEYKGYRWGMAIDLSSCIGCGACVIGCQAENNIPVVGRDNVRKSREMHWIRIDRYYSGSPENPDVVFQPMLCQHCENAPCETVCPVLATAHDDEGTNQQTYNRCVGTRYCQNNCPYKTRRFNFFDHWKNYEGTANMVWNPDVTVRTRGIMEKCTFCIQRIREAKDEAALSQKKVNDSMLKTACQQTCPTDAIVFGDINNPESAVSRLSNQPHAFRVLEVLNTKPSIAYLSKVRNKEADHSKGHGAGHDDGHGNGHGSLEQKGVNPNV